MDLLLLFVFYLMRKVSGGVGRIFSKLRFTFCDYTFPSLIGYSYTFLF